jgi:hypothetical protein
MKVKRMVANIQTEGYCSSKTLRFYVRDPFGKLINILAHTSF